MLVSSTVNPSVHSSIQLIVLHHGGERILVPVDQYAKFSDLLAFAAEQWNLKSQDLVIETDELDICAGKFVQIHETSWTGVKNIVGNVRIRTARPYRPSNSSQNTESAEEDEVEKQMRPASQKSDYCTVSSGSSRNEVTPKQNEGSQHLESRGDTLNLFNDITSKEKVPSSIVRVRDEKQTVPTEAVSNSKTTNSVASTSSADGSSLRSPHIDQIKNKTIPNPISEKPSGSSIATTSSNRSGNSGISTANRAPEPNRAAVPTEATEVSDRVLIIIEAPGYTDEARGFRIRREHTIQTVLKGASKALGLDYSRATLLMVVDDEDEEDEMKTVKCNSTDTMASLGIEDNQRFMIMMSKDSEEEEDEDSN